MLRLVGARRRAKVKNKKAACCLPSSVCVFFFLIFIFLAREKKPSSHLNGIEWLTDEYVRCAARGSGREVDRCRHELEVWAGRKAVGRAGRHRM